MKNKFIQKNLEIYADSFECKEELLQDAYAQMDLMADQSAYFNAHQNHAIAKPAAKKSPLRPFAKFAALAASVIAAVILFVFVILPGLSSLFPADTTDIKPNSYSLYSLTRESASGSEVQQINGVKYIDKQEYVLVQAYVFKDKQDGETYSVALKYKTTMNGNTDEILIVSDLKGGLSGYSHIREGETLKNYDNYENGEYYSYLSIRGDGRAYYITIMSPSRYAAYDYEDILSQA